MGQENNLISGRVEGFDLLRGLCAIAVAVYHVLYWTDTATLTAWGRYGVYIFFVLSGASVYIGYHRKFDAGYNASKFIGLRFARLAPLFIIVLLYSLRGLELGDLQGLARGFLNGTMLFGSGMPGRVSVVTGGWSLGIEFLFYLVFPVIAAIVGGRSWLYALVGSFFIQHAYVNLILSNGASLADEWANYTQLMSFLFYFVAGCCIGRLIESGILKYSAWWILGVFVFAIPLCTMHDLDNLIGIDGVILSLCAVAIVACIAGVRITGRFAAVSDYLGKASYGLYLLHPILYLKLHNKTELPPLILAGVVIVISIAIALLIDRFVEMPVRRYARKALT